MLNKIFVVVLLSSPIFAAGGMTHVYARYNQNILYEFRHAISNTSYDGICRQLGYAEGSAGKITTKKLRSPRDVFTVDDDGNFVKMYYQSDKAVESIFCLGEKDQALADQFSAPEYQESYIRFSPSNSITGVCRSLGYPYGVENSGSYSYHHPRFRGDKYSTILVNGAGYAYGSEDMSKYISSFYCVGKKQDGVYEDYSYIDDMLN